MMKIKKVKNMKFYISPKLIMGEKKLHKIQSRKAI